MSGREETPLVRFRGGARYGPKGEPLLSSTGLQKRRDRARYHGAGGGQSSKLFTPIHERAPLLHAGGIRAKVMKVLRFGVASAWPRFGQLCQSLPAKREVSNDTSADDQAIAEPLR